MSLRQWLMWLLACAGFTFLAIGLRGYVIAWSPAADDPANAIAAGRNAMRALPMAAFGMLLLVAAGIGLWRDRSG